MIKSVYDIELSEREKAILRTIVHLYVLKASPIGSRYLAKQIEKEIRLSPASIRNVMADLEDMEFVTHPHTSAGRVPTDKGYRFYVDSLMEVDNLTEPERRTVQENLNIVLPADVLKEASRLLGMLSHYLSIVEMPHIKEFHVEKIELVELASDRLLVVIALDSRIVHTVTLEANFEVDYRHLASISSYINEKIQGKPLSYLRENFQQLITDFEHKDLPLVRLFIDSVDKIFERDSSEDKLLIAGTRNLLKYPEFEDLDKIKSIIEIMENEDIIIHLLDKSDETADGLRVLIGSEMVNETLEDYSLVVSKYKIGSAHGSIGLIGPKRMNYSKMMALVQYFGQVLSKIA